jgi:hypothetical protein
VLVVVVAETVVAVDVVDVGMIEVVDAAVVAIVEVGVVVEVEVVDVVDELLQDDSTSDVTKRKASENKIIPLFM